MTAKLFSLSLSGPRCPPLLYVLTYTFADAAEIALATYPQAIMTSITDLSQVSEFIDGRVQLTEPAPHNEALDHA